MHPQEQVHLQKWQIWLPLMLSIAVILGMVAGVNFRKESPSIVIDNKQSGEGMRYLGYGRMEELIRYIDAKYVDDVNGEELVKAAIDYLLEQLDPHSTYITKEQLQEVNEQLQGNFDGIGIEFMLLEDTIVVVTPLPGGPSEAVGIMAGDKIISVGDSVIAGTKMTTGDVTDFLRGESGTDVELGILRPGEKKLREFLVTRGKIPTHSLDVAFMIDESTGYFKINRFSATTYKEFMTAVEELVEKKGMKNVVLDLRQNPGGYLQEATKMLSQLFSERDKLLVYTEGRTVRRVEYETTGRNFYDIDKIAVLIDEGSASASEIVAGAIQDWDRGVIIGRRSFGKGLVQEQYKLSDGSALRLTVARYYTPSGRCIQKSYSDLEEYENDVLHRFETGELEDRVKIEIEDTTKYYTAGGRIVYGGGGITPDIFIPLDTLLFNEFYLHLRQQIPSYVYRYYVQNIGDFKELSAELFLRDFEVSNFIYNQFLDYAFEKGVKRQSKILPRIEQLLRSDIKARLAKHLFGDDVFYKVLYQDDPMLDEALKAFSRANPLVEKK